MNVLCIVDRDHERSVVVLDQKLKTKKLLKIPSVHPLPPSLPALSAGGKGEGGGGLNLQPNFQKGEGA